MDKILIVNKPYGLTTSYVVNKLKKLYNALKAGHTGTLDPLATGVIVIFFGRLTKLIPFMPSKMACFSHFLELPGLWEFGSNMECRGIR